MKRRFLALPCFALLAASANAQLYWDTTAGLGNGVGGSGTPGTTYSVSSTGDATLTTATSSSDLIFQGTAGTVDLGNTSLTAHSFTFNTSGYTLTNTFRGVGLIGPVSLGAGVTLNLQAATGDFMSLGSVSGGSGSSLALINGAATEALTAQSGSTIAVAVNFGSGQTISLGGAGTGVTYTGAVTYTGPNSGVGLSLGNANFTNTISDGTATVTITSGVAFSGSGNTWGTTSFTSANSAALTLQAANALPTGTTVSFNAGGGFTNTLRLSGNNTTIGQLTVGGGTGTNTVANNSTSTAATLTISGSDTSGNFTGTIIDGGTVGTKSLALVRSGTGTTTLGGNNTYSGGTTISGGQLIVTSSTALGTGSVTISGGTLTVATPSLSLGSGSSFLMNGGTLNLSLGSAANSIIGSGGSLSITGGTLSLTEVAGFSTSTSYTIFSGFTTEAVSGLTITGAPSGFTADLSNAGVLSFTASAVPEPSTYALIMGAAALAAAAWRRRRVGRVVPHALTPTA